MVMPDQELNFSELFESSKNTLAGDTPIHATAKQRQAVQNAYYIENISFDIIDPVPRSYKSIGTNSASLRRFRNHFGKLKSCLDLHGHTRIPAINMLIDHIRQCQIGGIPYFLVIFGKGLSSPGEPVLKKTVCSYMIANPEILAYEFAMPKDGGDGAAYVMLKKR